MSKDQKKLYASCIVGLLLSASALSAEQTTIVKDVKDKVPYISNVQDKQLLENFIYEHLDSLDYKTIEHLNILIGDNQPNNHSSFAKFDRVSYMQAIIDRSANDINFRENLISNPDEALSVYPRLTSKEKEILSSMRRVGLEELGIDTSGIRGKDADNGFKLSRSDLLK